MVTHSQVISYETAPKQQSTNLLLFLSKTKWLLLHCRIILSFTYIPPFFFFHFPFWNTPPICCVGAVFSRPKQPIKSIFPIFFSNPFSPFMSFSLFCQKNLGLKFVFFSLLLLITSFPVLFLSFDLYWSSGKSISSLIMVLVEAFMEILERPTIGGVFVEIIMFLVPVWIAFLLGVMVGWIWKPKWATFKNCKFDFSAPSSPTALVPSPPQSFPSSKARTPAPSFGSCIDASLEIENFDNGPLVMNKGDTSVITDEDLEQLWNLVERKDGGPPWKHMMDRSTSTMSFQGWQRDPENGPPQYCSRTVYEDASPELLRDFFWDDEFRLKWDDMLVHAETVEECPTTGTMIVHWVRKFPFFCSDREYIIGRRIWESGRSYYCVTKGVPCPAIPRKDKPRRVDLFYSSWYIQAVESRRGNGQLTACEVILFHYEDMGIPWEIAKFGVKQGMWGTVRKIERGFRSYQKFRVSNMKISRCAFMAQVNTKIDPEYMKSMEGEEESSATELQVSSPAKSEGINIPKLLIIGGALLVACTLDRGIIPKALLFNVGRRFGNIGKRASPRI